MSHNILIIMRSRLVFLIQITDALKLIVYGSKVNILRKDDISRISVEEFNYNLALSH